MPLDASNLNASDFGLAPVDRAPSTPSPAVNVPIAPKDSTAPVDESSAPTITVHATRPPTGAQSPKMADLKAEDFGLAAAPAASPPAAAAPSDASVMFPRPADAGPPSVAERFVRGLSAGLEGIPRGVLGGATIDYGNAALATPMTMLTKGEGPSAAFNDALTEEQQQHTAIHNAAPVANVGGEVGGALGTGFAVAPSLAYRAPAAATEMLPRVTGMLQSLGSYLGRNAAFGGLTNWMAGGSPTTGAAIGAGAAAALPPIAKGISAVTKTAAPLSNLFSKGAQESSVADQLGRIVSPGEIKSSPVGPLDLAQATNNPAVAAKVDIAPGYNAAANARLRGAQQVAAENQVAKIGAPASAPDASAAFTNAARSARGVAGREETRLWTAPKLAETPVTPDPIQASVNGAIAQMDPVMRDAMSPQLRALVNRLNGASETTVRDLNGVRGRLESVARNSLDGTERAQARTLSDAFMEGMDQVPEIAGRPARVVPPGWTQRAGQTVWTNGETIPEVVPDPEIKDAYQAARDYTRQMRTMFADPQLAALMKKAEGVYKKDPSEGAAMFFNFSNGSPEGPQSIAQLAEFVENLQHQPLGTKIAADLRDSARSYVAAALSRASRLGEGQNFNPKLMQDFLSKNMDWMTKSGLFEKPQIEAAEQLMNYAEMLRRPEQLLRQVNSATQPRQARAATFVDEIMRPWTRRLGELVLTAAAAHEHGGLGGALGLMASGGFESAVAKAENAMRETMAGVLLDSRVARDMLMKASAGNGRFMSSPSRDLLERLGLAVGSEVVPHFAVSRPSPTPLQVSH